MKFGKRGGSWLSAGILCTALLFSLPATLLADIQVFDDQSIGLDELIAGDGSLQVGDKTFSDFSFIMTGDIFASDVVVTPIIDDFGPGLRFSGENWSAIGEEFNGFVLQFSVEVVPSSGLLISDVHLRFNGAFIGDGFAEVVETIIDPATDLVVGQSHVYNPPPQFDDGFDLAIPLAKIIAIKDVQLDGDTGHRRLSDNRASISFIDQTFSQIPEPGTALLVAAGLFGLVLTTRRRR